MLFQVVKPTHSKVHKGTKNEAVFVQWPFYFSETNVKLDEAEERQRERKWLTTQQKRDRCLIILSLFARVKSFDRWNVPQFQPRRAKEQQHFPHWRL